MKKYRTTLPALPVITLALCLSSLISGCNEPASFQLSGTIRSTQVEAASEVTGKVLEIKAEEGSLVKKGDVLATIDSSMQKLVVEQQQSVVDMKSAKLGELKAGTRPEQLDQYSASVKAAEAVLNNARTGVTTAQTGYDYYLKKYEDAKADYEGRFIDENALNDMKFKLDTAKQQLDSAKKQLQSASAQLEGAKAQLALLEKGSTTQTIAAAEADLAQSQAALEQARLNLSRFEVKSPADGTFIHKNVEVGSMINIGASIGTVSDLTDLYLYMYVQQKNLRYINLNRELTLTGKALGDKSLKGKVTYISDEAEFTPKNTETDEDKDNTVFKVKVVILDKESGLKPGMTLDTVITME
ncbi:MAG: HlyD family efflux transporter periplasmic adaptor subunit [Clostridiales bacterium]|nr:HlyD family efflux transporter periplasmic adaptor subunit [Clostridiales bacterium]